MHVCKSVSVTSTYWQYIHIFYLILLIEFDYLLLMFGQCVCCAVRVAVVSGVTRLHVSPSKHVQFFHDASVNNS